MYLSPQSRGMGIGKLLMQKCLAEAKKTGYSKVYLETMRELTSAISMYTKFGFTPLNRSMGNSGHGGCDVWMMKYLD
jgi:putative acetyltransferase